MNPLSIRNVAIDDFAHKKRQTYYSVLINQDDGTVIEVFDSRLKEDLIKHLSKYSNVETATRDRAGCYTQALSRAFPEASQIADRFHLIKDLIDNCSIEIRKVIPNTSLLFNDVTLEILDEIGRKNKSILEKHRTLILELTRSGYGYKRITKILRKDYQYKSSLESVKKYCRYLKKYIINNNAIPIARRDICKLFYPKKGSDKRKARMRIISDLGLTDLEEACLKKYIEREQWLADLLELTNDFHNLLFKKKDKITLDQWLDKHENNVYGEEVTKFINGIRKHYPYIENAIKYDYSNGIAEGTVNKIKLIKRMMFGRCSFELLRRKIFLSQFRPS